MASQIQVFDQLKQYSSGMTNKQRIMLAVGAVLTLAALLGFVKLIAKPDFKPLFTDLDPQDAQRLATQLSAKGIPYEITPDGKSVNVAADEVDTARLQVASDGLPHSGRMGFELFDKSSWGQTDFDEKVNYQRALEGELERTIQTLHDVEGARVHLVMPEDSLFTSRERPAKCSVILKLKRGQLSDQDYQTISRLVSGAVDKLTPENVTVVDADTNRPLGSKPHGTLGDADMEQALVAKVMTTLEPVIGADRLRASVDVEYDPSTSEESRDNYDPSSVIAVASQSSEEQVGGAMPLGGVPGTSSNIPGATTKTAAVQAQPAGGVQSSKTQNQSFAVNHVSVHTLQPAGRIRRITAALAVDDATEPTRPGQAPKTRKRTDEEMKRIEALAKAALGIDDDRGDVLVVQNVSFEQPMPLDTRPANVAQRIRTTLQDWSTPVRYVSLLVLFLLLYLLLLRPLQKEALTAVRAMASRKREIASAAPKAAAVQAANSPAAALENTEGMARKDLIEKVRRDPQATGRLIQAWINEDAK
jgi:flagellar M-ring protein FliF